MVSVIMPAYNRCKVIGRAIESVLNQSYPDWELIIIDDCSTDASGAVIASYLHNGRIRSFKNPRNLGASYSRNLGLKEARGEYVVFFDSDDELDPEKLELQINEIRARECDVVFSGTRFRGGLREFDNLVDDGFTWFDFLYKRTIIHIESPLWSKNFLHSVGLFNPKIKCGQDWEYYLRCILQSPKSSTLRRPLSTAFENIAGRISNDRNLRYYLNLLESRYFVYSDHLPLEYRSLFESYIKHFIAEYGSKLILVSYRDYLTFVLRAIGMFGISVYLIPWIHWMVLRTLARRTTGYLKRTFF